MYEKCLIQCCTPKVRVKSNFRGVFYLTISTRKKVLPFLWRHSLINISCTNKKPSTKGRYILRTLRIAFEIIKKCLPACTLLLIGISILCFEALNYFSVIILIKERNSNLSIISKCIGNKFV